MKLFQPIISQTLLIAFTLCAVALITLSNFIPAEFVKANTAMPAAGTSPVIGATIKFTPSGPGGTITTTTDSSGKFSAQIGRGPCTLTIVPARIRLRNGQTMAPIPFQLYINFPMTRGLLAGGMNLGAAAASIPMMSNASISLSCGAGGTISGTITH